MTTAAAALVLLGLTWLPDASAATNLVTNPGFETGGTNGWSCTGTHSVVGSPVHSGAYALSSTPAGQDYAQCSQAVSVQPGSAYTLTAWVQGSYTFLGDTGTGTTDTSTWTAGSSAWSQLSTSFTTGPSTTTVTVYLHGWYGTGAFYADDVSLTGPGGGGDTQPPTAPANLRVTGTTSSTVSLAWNAATDNVGVTGYTVLRNGTAVTTVTGTSYTVTGLSAATTYRFTVTARDAAGNTSPPSNEVSATTGTGDGGGEQLLSQGRPATASSVETADLTADKAVDGNAATRWSSQFSDPQWLQVDLGSTATLTRVKLSWETAYGRAYRIETSNDASSWTQVYSTTAGDGGVDDLAVSGSGRYVRMYGTQRGTQWGYSLWELEVYGTPGSGGGNTPGAPTGLRVTGTTSSSVSLAWTAPSGTVTGYNVYQGSSRVTSVTGTSATVSGLSPSTTYTFAVTAYNSAGESPKSNTVTATTGSSGGGGSLPRHVLTGYWQNFTNGATPLRLRDVPSAYNLIAVAFADADPSKPGGVTFTLDPGLSSALGGYTDAQFTSDIATLHAQGRKVVISVGGQNGTVSVGDSTSAANFASSVYALMQRYGFDGVDIDLENGINAAAMGSALRQLSSKAGSGLVITMAPQTLDMQSTGMAYFQLALNIKDILTIVNTQYYNSGTMNGCDQKVYSQGTEDFMTALACIQLQGGLRPDQVGLGLPASPSAAGGGYVSPSVVNSALDCLATGTHCGSFKPSTTYPAIRGAMTWSINWDASNGYSFANTVGGHLGSLP